MTTMNMYSKEQMDLMLADKQDGLTFDSAPTSGSTNPVTSGGVYTALGDKSGTIREVLFQMIGGSNLPSQTLASGATKFLDITSIVNARMPAGYKVLSQCAFFVHYSNNPLVQFAYFQKPTSTTYRATICNPTASSQTLSEVWAVFLAVKE